MEPPKIYTRDQIKGMLVGLTLGDALGAPHEFYPRSGKDKPYTGRIQYTTESQMGHGHNIFLGVGSVTDDSTLTFALIESLINGKYDYHNALKKYLLWANGELLQDPENKSSMAVMGKNTRALLKGVTTEKGYINRFEKHIGMPFSPYFPLSLTATQSNGSLMRCAPLITVYLQQPEAIYQDCYLTNPTSVNFECSYIYFNAMRGVLSFPSSVEGTSALLNWLLSLAKEADVREAIEQAFLFSIVEKREKRDLGKPKKGWVVHGLYCALAGLRYPTLSECLDWVIGANLPSDTDTNACIAGALYGLKVGWNNLDTRAKENYSKVRIPIADGRVLLGEAGIEYYVNKLYC
jgi:ADP-ribosylglycohydrolase